MLWNDIVPITKVSNKHQHDGWTVEKPWYAECLWMATELFALIITSDLTSYYNDSGGQNPGRK